MATAYRIDSDAPDDEVRFWCVDADEPTNRFYIPMEPEDAILVADALANNAQEGLKLRWRYGDIVLTEAEATAIAAGLARHARSLIKRRPLIVEKQITRDADGSMTRVRELHYPAGTKT